MKKFLALLLALAMTLALVACGEKKDDTKTDGAGDGEKTYKVAMICDSSINDGGWGAACYNAMVKAAEDKGWTYDVTDSISQDQYYETIVAFCNLGYDMIYAPGNQYTDAVLQAAEEYPDIAFALLNGAESTPEKAANGNVASLLPNAEQIGWIAGALAGLMTESGKLGFIGGMELDTTKGKIAGFEAAAKYVGEQEGKTVELLAVPYPRALTCSSAMLPPLTPVPVRPSTPPMRRPAPSRSTTSASLPISWVRTPASFAPRSPITPL